MLRFGRVMLLTTNDDGNGKPAKIAEEPHMKILVVDDDPDIRRILRSLLGKRYHVIEAVDGLEALEAVKRDRPRLVLLDVAMPAMNGVEALKAVRMERMEGQTSGYPGRHFRHGTYQGLPQGPLCRHLTP